MEGEDPYAQIEQKLDSVVNGRVYNFNGISVWSTPPCRISVPYCPDSRLLAMMIVLRLLEFFELCTQRQKELQDMDLSTINRTQS